MTFTSRVPFVRQLTTGALGAAALWATGLALGLAAGCDDEATTSGERVTFEVYARLGDTTDLAGADGWTFDVERVAIPFGPLYFFTSEPLAQLRRRAPSGAIAMGAPSPLRWLSIQAAGAHPGHYDPGQALGQLLAPAPVELSDEPVLLGAGDGVTGLYLSGSVSFADAGDDAPEGLGDTALVLEATGTDGATTLAFRFEATAAQLSGTGASASVVGTPFDDGDVTGAGTVTLELELERMLSGVSLADVEPGADGARVTLEPGTAAYDAVAFGARKFATYRFGWLPNP